MKEMEKKSNITRSRQEILQTIGKNNSFCVIPWLHLHVMPNSSVIPCCVSPYDDHYGNVSSEDVHEIWNNQKFKDLRLKMLNGELPEGCKHCHKLEEAGFPSMRTKLNTRFQSRIPEYVNQTEEDGSFIELKLKYIDIRFSNLCNLKCRGCSPALSSSWYDDYTQMYGVKPEGSKVKSISVDSPGFYKVFNELVLDAEDIYFGGGEPLITKEHFDLLRLLIEKKKTDVHLSYNTNLSTLTYGNHNLVDLWSKFKSVTLGISIDDLGARAEYFRSGTRWSVFEKNLFNLRDNYKGIRRYINCTVNITNVFYLPEIYSYLFSEGIMSASDFNINLLFDPVEYRIDAIPYHAKLKIKDKLEKFLPFLEEQKLFQVKKDFQNTIDHMMKEDRSYLFQKFLDTNSRVDKVRNESFERTYPELAGILGLTQTPVEIKPVTLKRPGNKTLLPDAKVSIAIYNHDYFNDPSDASKYLTKITIPGFKSSEFQVIKENDWDAFLNQSTDDNNEIAVIAAAGLFLVDGAEFFKELNKEALFIKQNDIAATGLIYNFDATKLLPYFHEQLLILNLKIWNDIGRPSLGRLFSIETSSILNAELSDEKFFDDTTPMTIRSGGNFSKTGELAWGSDFLIKAIGKGYVVKQMPKNLWASIKYAYPRDPNLKEKQEIDEIILRESRGDDLESLKLSPTLKKFFPDKIYTNQSYKDVVSLVKAFTSVTEVVIILNNQNQVADLEGNVEFLNHIKTTKVTVLLANNFETALATQIQPGQKFIVLASELSPNFISELAWKLKYRLWKHSSSAEYVLGKGLDFLSGVMIDDYRKYDQIADTNWVEVK